MQILVVEDEQRMAELLEQALHEEGHQVVLSRDGREGFEIARYSPFDVIVLDVMLPGMDGLAVARKLRDGGNQTPVLMLTARDAPADIVNGLNSGADDYLTKPFSPKELAARIKAVLRRRAPQLSGDAVEAQGLRLDPATRRVTAQGKRVELSPSEFRLLHFLMTHPERVYSRAQLLDHVWGDHVFIEERTVDVHIRRLRKALEPSGHDRLIDTVRGSGYGIRTG